jgi:hypothetical protein
MKCPKCGHKHPAKQGMHCSKCRHHFVFNPKESRTMGLTDGKFEAAIKRAGQNGTYFFTANQLYAAYASSQKVVRVPLIIGGAVMAFGGIMFVATSPLIGMGLFAVASLAFLAAYFSKPQVLRREYFQAAVGKWLSRHGKIQGLITEPALHQPPPEWPEEDIYDYGAERILIVQRDLLVDLFVRNKQHAEQRMLVISESGYPEYLIPLANQLLDERDDLPVYLMHDADDAGTQMKNRVRSLSWLRLRNHKLVDMGFFKSDFEKLKRTRNFDNRSSDRALPADALMMGAMVTGLGACFLTQSTFADELLRERANEMNSGSSFG